MEAAVKTSSRLADSAASSSLTRNRLFIPIQTLVLVLLAARPAAGFELRRSEDGRALVWNRQAINVVLDSEGAPPTEGVEDAVRAGFAAWTDSGVPMKVKLRSRSRAGEVGKDGTNVIRWVSAEWPYEERVVAMTVSLYRRSTAAIREADIVLNARDHAWGVSTEGTDTLDIQNVLAHEAGHLFGVAHSPDPEATMFATTPAGEVTKRTLSADDRAAVDALIIELSTRFDIKAEARREAEPTRGTASNALGRQGAGCSASGRAATRGWLSYALLLGSLLLLRRRLVRRGAQLLAALLALQPSTAGATVVHHLGLDDLARRAEAVVEGRVVAERSYWEKGMIVTSVTIKVSRCHAGRCAGATEVILRSPGGAVGDEVMVVDGAPRFRLGEKLLVLGRGPAQDMRAIGLRLGVFHIQRDIAYRDLSQLHLVNHRGAPVSGAVARLSVDALRQRIRQARSPLPDHSGH
jgi:hypothetical protein